MFFTYIKLPYDTPGITLLNFELYHYTIVEGPGTLVEVLLLFLLVYSINRTAIHLELLYLPIAINADVVSNDWTHD